MKLKFDRSVDRFRARFAGLGNKQECKPDYNENFVLDVTQELIDYVTDRALDYLVRFDQLQGLLINPNQGPI